MADEVNYYELLGINQDCTSKEISKAYRKKALRCHPDKNPDNPNAAELFHKLNKAFEVIGNPKAKVAYDRTLKAKERVKLRTQAYDSKRKRFKEDLEQREKTSQEDYVKEEVLVKNLEQEIERLREEGLKLLEQEQKLMKEQIEAEKRRMGASSAAHQDISVTPKLKIQWKSEKKDITNGGYSSRELLFSMFVKYGEIENLLISSKKKGSAIVEFKDFKSAEMAVANERGNAANPLKISWLQGGPQQHGSYKETPSRRNDVQQNATSPQDGLATERDFECLVMRKLRQAEERKRLCEEIAKEEALGS